MPLLACPTRDELRLYFVGKLGDDRSEEIDAHLDNCTDCQALLETVGGSDDTFVNSLKHSVEQDEYLQEPQCQEALALIDAIGREPTFAGAIAADDAPAEEPDLGQIHVYKLLAKLGEGGMGAVYKALHLHLNKVVALKLLPKEQTEDAQSVARFRREMLAVGALEHPNIVGAHDAGEHEGKHFLVMEYVKGQDLSKLSRQLGPLPVAEACELVRQAAVGLQHAHEHGLVHRDIKPSNLMLTSDILASGGRQPSDKNPAATGHDADHLSHQPTNVGRSPDVVVKILDLGLALLQEQQADKPRDLTSTGQMMGTLDYMAPEQGDDSHEVDIRADIYSLGATLYKLLTGEPPYGSAKYNTPVKKLMALATEPAPQISDLRDDLPAELASVIHRMLEKDPSQRPTTPAEVADLLGPFADGSDLFSLLERSGAGSQTDEEPRSRSTHSHFSSALQDTTQHQHKPQPVAFFEPATGTTETFISAATASVGQRRWLGPVIGLGLGFAAIVMLGIVLTFQTKDGKVEIVLADGVDSKDIEVAFKQRGEVIEVADAKQGWTVTLADGDYSVDLRGSTDRFKLDREQVTISRDQEEIVRISLKRADVKPMMPALAKAPFDAVTAKKYQQEWADHLGVPIEIEIELPGPETLSMILIPPGEFLMGSSDEEQQRLLEEAKAVNDGFAIAQIPKEGPQHRVRITQPFYLGKYEVTQAQWHVVMGNNPAHFKGKLTHPVEDMIWKDIPPFLNKLNACISVDGLKFTLPTVAQWEYACRAGTTAVRYCDATDEELNEHAWFNANAEEMTHPVGQLQPNPFGLYDMLGNVREWCADAFDPEYYERSPVDDPICVSGSSRSSRGGAFSANLGYQRAAYRDANRDDLGDDGSGFRLALILYGDGRAKELFKLLPTVESTEPLSPAALATHPAKIDGLESWTVETTRHRGLVRALAFSPDGELLAMGSDDGMIRLVDPESGELKRILMGHAARINSVSWSGDGKYVLSGSSDRTARLWDSRSGEIVKVFDGYDQPVRFVGCSPVDNKYAMMLQDGQLELWEFADGPANVQSAWKWKSEYQGNSQDLSWYPDGHALALVQGSRLVVLDASTGVGSRIAIQGAARSCSAGANGFVAVVGTAEGNRPHLWYVDGSHGEIAKELEWPAFSAFNLHRVAWSPDGSKLGCSRAGYRTIVLISQRSDDNDEQRLIWDGPSGPYSLDIAWAPDNATLAASYGDGVVRLWNAQESKLVQEFPAHPNFAEAVLWSSTGNFLATTTDTPNSEVYLWKTRALELANRIGRTPTLDSYSTALAWIPEDDKIVVPFQNNGYSVGIWDAATGERIGDLGKFPVGITCLSTQSPFHEALISNWEGIAIYGLDEPSAIREEIQIGTAPLIAARSPNGEYVVYGQRPLDFWMVLKQFGRETKKWDGLWAKRGLAKPVSIAWSSDSKYVASGHDDDTIELFDITGPLDQFEGGQFALRWSSDNSQLVAVSSDGKLNTWQPQTGKLLNSLSLAGGTVAQADWSPDGKVLATANLNNTLRFHNGEDGKHLLTAILVSGNVEDESLRIAPSGHYQGDPRVWKELIYVAKPKDGPLAIFSPDEFEEKYGWKNDPSRVPLLPE